MSPPLSCVVVVAVFDGEGDKNLWCANAEERAHSLDQQPTPQPEGTKDACVRGESTSATWLAGKGGPLSKNCTLNDPTK